MEELSKRAWRAKIKRTDVVPGMYNNMRVCSDYFVGGSPSTLHDVNYQDWAPSLKLVFETLPKVHYRQDPRSMRELQREGS